MTGEVCRHQPNRTRWKSGWPLPPGVPTGRRIVPPPKNGLLVVGAGRWYNTAGETAMIELTEQQMLALENPEATPPRVVNPRTKETFVLLRIDEYERRSEASVRR